MRIAIDCRYVRERPSGIGEYVSAIAQRLPALAPRDHFDLWAHPLGLDQLPHGPNVTRQVVTAEANGPGTLLWPTRIADLRGVDVLHAPSNILGVGHAARTVVTVHDLMYWRSPWLTTARGVAPWFQHRFFASGLRLALARATRIIAISRATADEIAVVSPAARRKTTVIHHGVDARFSPAADADASRARAASALGFDAPYFIAVGQNVPYKNHVATLEAFADGAARGAGDEHLVFVQRLERSGALPRRARELGVEGRVHFAGPLAEAVLLDVLRGALALVQFSVAEGFGMPVLEAMAAGTPVVASATPALIEIGGGAPLHVPLRAVALAAALRRVAASPALRAELREKGLARAAGFSWDASAAAHLAVYRDAIS